MARIGYVEPVLVARAGSGPSGDVVALLYLEVCDLFVATACGGDGNDFSLGPLFALVKPDGAAEDGQVL